MRTQDEALAALTESWPAIIEESRSVLGPELHYQAITYHCLRETSRVPSEQIGMNVKIWIPNVISDHFKVLDLRKSPGFQGGFEPIPDVVVFKPEIGGDFRRRNYENTLTRMLMAIEIKASDRHRGRLRPKEIVEDILKLDALRHETRHRGADVLPTIIVYDTAPDPVERMTKYAVNEARLAAEKHRVCLFYLSQEEEFHTIPAL